LPEVIGYRLQILEWIRVLIQFSGLEREVKKATRDLNQLLNGIESPMSKLETLQKKYSELLADMKKLDRDYAKNKKRADQLQKEKDQGRSELSKTTTMKDKLEKLCRELTKENKKVKVRMNCADPSIEDGIDRYAFQDEHKKLEDTEKRNRESLNDKFDTLMWDIQDMSTQKETPETRKADVAMDDVYVTLRANSQTRST
jgi:predicted  nucleic acid-binding Zn-ribbon protein